MLTVNRAMVRSVFENGFVVQGSATKTTLAKRDVVLARTL